MTKKSIKLNYLYNAGYQILMIFAPLITTPYVSRVLSADGIGTSSYIESILSYFTMFAVLGTTTYAQREISYCQEDKRKRSEVFWNMIIFRTITTFICTLVYLAFAFTRSENISIYIVMTINLIATVADITWFFQGLEEFGKIVGRNFVCRIINIVFIFTFVRDKDDLIWYVLGNAAIYLISNLSLWFYLPKYIVKANKSSLRPFSNLSVIITLFVPTIATKVYTVLDKTMIGVFTKTAAENGYYEQSMKIARMVLAIITSLGTVMIPRIGFYFAKGDKDAVQDYMYRGYRFVWFLGIPLSLGIFGVSDNLVPWFFGPGYEKVALLLKIVCFLLLAIGINNLTGMQYMIPTKREKPFTKSVMLGAVSNFVFNIIFIPLIQSVGAAIASVIAESIIAIVQLFWMRKEISTKKVLYVSIHYWIAGLLMLFVLRLENVIFTASMLNTLLMVLSGSVVYFVVLLILRDTFFVENVETVLRKLRIKK